jgi:hypothetical protein
MSLSEGFHFWLGAELAKLAIAGAVFGALGICIAIAVLYGWLRYKINRLFRRRVLP